MLFRSVDREVVVDKNIGHDHADIKEVVHYVPDHQRAWVTYIDHNTGKELETDRLDGVTHAWSGYKTFPKINYYVARGYKFISDTSNGREIQYDNDDAKDQYYTVILDA